VTISVWQYKLARSVVHFYIFSQQKLSWMMSSIAPSKLSRKLQVLSAMVLILLILGFTLMYGAKYFLEFKAENNAEALILAHSTEKMSNEEKALSIARAVYNANLDSQRSPKVPFLLRISPYLTH